MLRLPCDLLDPDVVEGYCVGDQVSAWVTEEFVVLDFTSQDQAGDFDYDADDDPEPPVPPGLGMLTAAQRALAEFLRLDEDLLTIAAHTSPPLEQIAEDPGELAAWVKRLPIVEKDRLRRRVVQGDAARIRMKMLRRFRGENAPNIPVLPHRTVANLLDDAARLRSDRERRLTAQHAEEAHQEKTRTLARERRLDELAHEETAAWSRVDALIATRKPAEYDAATTLLTDPQTLAKRDGRHDTFAHRITALRQAHARKPSLIQRLDQAGV